MQQILIRHRFIDYVIDPTVEILIVGIFNPDTGQTWADIFYGRSRNFLWRLLPVAFGADNLKDKPKADKFKFIEAYKIGFIDLIKSVKVDVGEEANYNDAYIDSRVWQWRNVMEEIKKLKNLRKVCFTRKTFSGTPHIKEKINAVAKYCDENKIQFRYLSSPTRGYTNTKEAEWIKFFQENN